VNALNLLLVIGLFVQKWQSRVSNSTNILYQLWLIDYKIGDKLYNSSLMSPLHAAVFTCENLLSLILFLFTTGHIWYINLKLISTCTRGTPTIKAGLSVTIPSISSTIFMDFIYFLTVCTFTQVGVTTDLMCQRNIQTTWMFELSLWFQFQPPTVVSKLFVTCKNTNDMAVLIWI